MITVSELAAETLTEALKASAIQAGMGLRLREDGERLNLDLDAPNANDRVIDRGGVIMLIVDRDMETEIGDALIDVDTDGEEPRLVIRRMNQS